MDMNVRQVIIDKNRTYIKTRTDKDVAIDDMYAIHDSTVYFKVVKIETIDQYIVEVTLEQVGSYYKRIKKSEDATNIVFDELSRITDDSTIKKINTESCYC